MKVTYSFNLSRVLKHIKDNTFGIVSGYLGGLSLKENKERQKKLKDMVKSKGYGYKEIKGFWKGESGELEEEYSLFIPNVTFEDIKSFGKEFDQEAIIYGNPSVDEIIVFNLRKNSTIHQFKGIQTNPNDAWDAYSKIKNKSFKFSEVDWYMDEPSNRTSYMGALSNDAWCDLTKAWDISEEEDRKITITKKAHHKLS